jgi:protein gp37
VFINSMSDWLDEEVPIEWLADLLWTLHRYPFANYQLLSKRPHLWQQRMKAVQVLRHPAASIAGEWLDGKAPPYLQIGATIEKNKYRHRIDVLCGIPAKVRFLSCEPLLEDLNLSDHLWKSGCTPHCVDRCCRDADCPCEPTTKLHWIIAGGESGPGSRPTHPEWLRSLRDQATAANIPLFFKQWGSWIPIDHTAASKGKTMILAPDGTDVSHLKIDELPFHSEPLIRIGSKNTGHVLDSQIHQQFPI